MKVSGFNKNSYEEPLTIRCTYCDKFEGNRYLTPKLVPRESRSYVIDSQVVACITLLNIHLYRVQDDYRATSYR